MILASDLKYSLNPFYVVTKYLITGIVFKKSFLVGKSKQHASVKGSPGCIATWQRREVDSCVQEGPAVWGGLVLEQPAFVRINPILWE